LRRIRFIAITRKNAMTAVYSIIPIQKPCFFETFQNNIILMNCPCTGLRRLVKLPEKQDAVIHPSFHPPVTLYNEDTPMTETLPPEIVMDDAEIDEAVAFINNKVAAHVLRGSLEVGEYVLAKFFNNDIHLAGSRNRYKPVSYRKLCDHPDLSVSRFTLMKMVKTAAQQGFLVAAVKNYLVRINRWIRKLDVPEGMTNQSVITGADAADRGKILDVAGGILEDISLIANRIQRLVTSLTESPQGRET
jgi:hypothetical protein